MSWYFYVGERVVSIPRGDGVSVAVRPYTKVEILGDSPKLRALRRKKKLRLTGAPVIKPNIGEPKGEIVPPVQTKFSESVEELGVVKGPGSYVPKKPVVEEEQSNHDMKPSDEKPNRRRRRKSSHEPDPMVEETTEEATDETTSSPNEE